MKIRMKNKKKILITNSIDWLKNNFAMPNEVMYFNSLFIKNFNKYRNITYLILPRITLIFSIYKNLA